MPTQSLTTDLVSLFASTGQPKSWLERKIAEMAQGVIVGLRDSTLPMEDAREELFSLKNYESIRAHHLSKDLKTMFEWGMELGTVAKHAPHAIGESLDEMDKLAKRVIAKSYGGHGNGRRRQRSRSGGIGSR